MGVIEWLGTIPTNWLAGAMITVALLMAGTIRGWSSLFPLVIRLTGTSEVGKTTTHNFILKQGDVPLQTDRTIGWKWSQNTTYQWDRKERSTRRVINLRDVEGGGWQKGYYWRILMKDQPAAILNFIDERALDSGVLGMSPHQNQMAAFKTLVSIILSDEYKNRVRPYHRLRLFVLVVNKSDIYGPMGKEYKDIAAPFQPYLQALQMDGIEIRIRGIQATDRTHVEGLMETVLVDLDVGRHPWRDVWAYWRSGLRREVRDATGKVRKWFTLGG